MEENESQAATDIIEEHPAPGKRKNKVQALVVLGAVILAAALIALAVTWNGRSRDQGQSMAPGDLEQLKYDAQQQENDKNKAAQIRDGSLLLRKEDADTQARLDSLMSQLEQNSGQEIPVPMANDRQVQIEEEAIAQLMRDQRPAVPAAAYPVEPAGVGTKPAPPNMIDGGDRPMFVYSRTFGGAKFVDAPKNPGGTQGPSSNADVRPDTSVKTAALQPPHAQKPFSSEGPRAIGKASEEKTAVIFTDLPPVTLYEGEMIDAVLVNRIVADTEASPVICQISKDVFDNSGRYVVLPANSRIVGLSQVVSYKGAHRLFISFHRIILPNGPSIDFPPSKKAMSALDDTAALGVVSKVERHWFLQFGTAIFFGALDGLSGAAQRGRDLFSTRSIVLGRTSENFQRILDNIMSQYSSIVPTIRVDQGKKIKIYLSDDVLISPYAEITGRSYYANR
jgi:type IV secretory pathway VirB10-like protein